MVKKKKLVELESGVLATLATSKAVTAAFPFIAQAMAAKKKGCGCGAAAKSQAEKLNKIKQQISGMGDEMKRKFRDLLNTEQVRVRWTDARGKPQVSTF